MLKIKLADIFAKKQSNRERTVKIAELLFMFFSLFLVAHVLYSILFKMPTWGLFNADIAPEYTYGKMCFEQGTLYPDGFVGCWESLFRGLVIPFIFFYGITKAPILSYQLSAIVGFALLVISLLCLLKSLKMKRLSMLFVLCLFLSFVPNDITSMLPIDAGNTLIYPIPVYSLFGTAVLLTICLKMEIHKCLISENCKGSKRICLLLCAVLILAVRFGFTTIKLAMVLYIPLLAVDFLRVLHKFVKNESIEKADVVSLIISAVTLLIYAIAYVCFLHFFSHTIISTPYTVTDIGAWLNWNVISSHLWCFLKNLGFSGGGKFSSVTGIRFIFSCLMVAFEMLSLILLAKYRKVKNGYYECQMLLYWGMSIGITLLIYLFAGWTVSSRTLFVEALILPVLCGLALDRWSHNCQKMSPYFFVGLCLFAFLGTTLKIETQKPMYPDADIVAAAQYIEDSGYKYVAASFDYAGRIKNYSNGVVDNLHCLPQDITTLTPYRWLIDVRKFEEENIGTPYIFLISDEEENRILQEEGKVFFMLSNCSEKVSEFGPYNLYKFNENPFTLVNKIDDF